MKIATTKVSYSYALSVRIIWFWSWIKSKSRSLVCALISSFKFAFYWLCAFVWPLKLTCLVDPVGTDYVTTLRVRDLCCCSRRVRLFFMQTIAWYWSCELPFGFSMIWRRAS